jgi:hypothetical protein
MLKRSHENVHSEIRLLLMVLMVTVLAAVPAIVAVCVISAKTAYVLSPFLGLLAFSACGLTMLLKRLGVRRGNGWKPMLAASVCSLAVLPGGTGSAPWYLTSAIPAEKREGLENVATIRFLADLDLNVEQGRTLHVLEADYGRGAYAGWNFARLRQTACRPFSECIQHKRPEVIVNNAQLESYYASNRDFAYSRFLRQPAAFGYKGVDIPGHSIRVFLRNDVVYPEEQVGEPRPM